MPCDFLCTSSTNVYCIIKLIRKSEQNNVITVPCLTYGKNCCPRFLAYVHAIIQDLCLFAYVIGVTEDGADMEIINAMFRLVAFYFSAAYFHLPSTPAESCVLERSARLQLPAFRPILLRAQLGCGSCGGRSLKQALRRGDVPSRRGGNAGRRIIATTTSRIADDDRR